MPADADTEDQTPFDRIVTSCRRRGPFAVTLGGDYFVDPAKDGVRYEGITRTNARAFATMGVDGVHTVILVDATGRAPRDAPVLQVCPMDCATYAMLGRDFADYLAAGCRMDRGTVLARLAGDDDSLHACSLLTSSGHGCLERTASRASTMPCGRVSEAFGTSH